MPSTEAKIKKNRCANCFDCPSCGHSLVVRAMAVPNTTNPLEDPQKANVKKMHYLTCGFCRWTTRDVGLPDQLTRKHVLEFHLNLLGKALDLLCCCFNSTGKQFSCNKVVYKVVIPSFISYL